MAFRYAIVAAGAPTPTLKVEGRLPAGVTLAADGTLSGIPRTLGRFPLQVSVANIFGTDTAKFVLDVRPSPGFDVNGDGLPDLPVGSPREDVGRIVDAGVVTVLFGAGDGTYGRGGSLQLTQETVGQVSEKGDKFGAAVVVAEVTGDRYPDLIVGAPGENNRAGQVVVIHGAAAGMTGKQRTVLRQGLSGAAGAAEAGDGFGSVVSVGNDGMWVGAPRENLGRAVDAGVVTRFRIRPLRTAGSIQYRQGAHKIPGTPERGDRFGSALSGGGVAIGAPGEDVGRIVNAGSVTWNLTTSFTQNSRGIPGTAERGDQFGAAVAAAELLTMDDEDHVQSGMNALLVGAPGEDIGSVKDAGSVTLIGDTFDGLQSEGFLQNSWSTRQQVEAGDRFGASLLLATANQPEVDSGTGNTVLETEASLTVGAPGEDIGAAANTGAATTVGLGAGCSDTCRTYFDDEGTRIEQGVAGVAGTPRTGNAFGATLGGLPGVELGVVIGAPGRTVDNHSSAGSVTVLNPPPLVSQEIHQNSPGVRGSAETGDRFSTLPTV